MKKLASKVKLYLIGLIFGGLAVVCGSVVTGTIIDSNDVAYQTTTVKLALDDLYGLASNDVWQKIYPVGSVYISTNNVSPEILFGGTWEVFGQGRKLVGIDITDVDFNEEGKIGGSETKTIAEANLPAHSHSVSLNTGSAGSHTHSVSTTQKTGVATASVGNHQHSYTKPTGIGNTTLTTAQIPSHNHSYRFPVYLWKPSSYGWASGATKTCYTTPTTTVTAECATWSMRVLNISQTNNTGGGGAHNHGLTTASDNTGSNGGHPHTLTVPALSGTAASTGSHAHSVSGNTGNTGSGTALNTQDPYITVYMWKRTA